MTRRKLLIAAVALAVLAPIVLTGCKKTPAEVTTPWPTADRERTVPRPAEAARWPFTGKKATDPATLSRRPLSVKIENSAASRPQTGIGSADVVYESIAEGGVTRFNCIFHSELPARVGPVRSARLSDIWIVPQYQGLFFFSGASSSVNAAIRNANLPNLSEDAGVTKPYVRDRSRRAPHNLFLETAKAHATAQERGYETTVIPTGLQFVNRTEESTPTVTEIDIPFSQANRVRWVYQNGQYLRFNNGAAHNDAATGKQVTADNVVVMWAKYTVASRDVRGSVTYNIDLGSKNRVSIFRGGQRFDGTWTGSPDAPPKFTDAEGRPIKLVQGRTWFQVIPLDGAITMK